jgi:hypothetical protein
MQQPTVYTLLQLKLGGLWYGEVSILLHRLCFIQFKQSTFTPK